MTEDRFSAHAEQMGIGAQVLAWAGLSTDVARARIEELSR